VSDPHYTDFALLLARLWLGGMIFAHGWRHLRAVRSGPGMARWFESLGVRPGSVHAWTVTLTELAAGVALVAGFLTPFAYGGLGAICLVAAITNHRSNGFFSNNPGEGWEYTTGLGVLAIAFGTLGPGQWSLDHAFGLSFPFDNGTALLITALLDLGGTAAFLAAFWRPPAKQPA
jgi:putative oxidoreductase